MRGRGGAAVSTCMQVADIGIDRQHTGGDPVRVHAGKSVATLKGGKLISNTPSYVVSYIIHLMT